MTYRALPRPSVSNKQIQEYIEAASKGRNSQFVIRKGKSWLVRNHGNADAPELFTSRNDAISRAQSLAKKYRGTVFIFDNEGNLVENS